MCSSDLGKPTTRLTPARPDRAASKPGQPGASPSRGAISTPIKGAVASNATAKPPGNPARAVCCSTMPRLVPSRVAVSTNGQWRLANPRQRRGLEPSPHPDARPGQHSPPPSPHARQREKTAHRFDGPLAGEQAADVGSSVGRQDREMDPGRLERDVGVEAIHDHPGGPEPIHGDLDPSTHRV